MSNTSTSTLSWLDSSEQERRTVLELVSALNEPGTLDELGIGSIRDTIADTLFPGTSTIQTRARYFLFIPWIMQIVEASSTSNPNGLSQHLQLRLCDALDRTHGANAGVIGRQARAALQRWPDSIYWLGLREWGIRRDPGSILSYSATLRRSSSWFARGTVPDEPVLDGRHEATDGVRRNWVALPDPPAGFPDEATFELTAEEGRFLCERVALSNPSSYLADLLRAESYEDSASADFPWNHPVAKTALPSVRDWLNDARLFSLVHRGGAFLYNLMLAEFMDDESNVAMYQRRLAAWSESMESSAADLERWDRTAMWERFQGVNPRLKPPAREFVDRWHSIAVTRYDSSLASDDEARILIRNREHALKGMRSRLTYADARAARRGYPTSGRLDFRWTQVKRITADILASQESANA